MTGKKTNYKVSFFSNAQDIDAQILRWLNVNKFKSDTVDEDGVHIYHQGTGFGRLKKFFEYKITGNEVLIAAYFKSGKNPMPLNSKLTNEATPYIYLIQTLLDDIHRLSDQSNPQNANVFPGTDAPGDTESNSDRMRRQMREEGDEKATVFAFIVSIVNIFLSLLGKSYGILFILFAYVCAITGLRSSYRNLAIAALVLTSISLIYCALQLAGILAPLF